MEALITRELERVLAMAEDELVDTAALELPEVIQRALDFPDEMERVLRPPARTYVRRAKAFLRTPAELEKKREDWEEMRLGILTEDGITYMGIMILCCTLPIMFIYFPQWGGMFFGPSAAADATEEHYYSGEWSPEEKERGLHLPNLKFAENSKSERGRRRRHAPTVPLEYAAAGI